MAGPTMTDPRPPRHVLVLTWWGHADALVQTYVLPYVRLMLAALPPGSTVHLVTLEKDDAGLVPSVAEAGVRHHPYVYHSLGIGGAGMILSLVRRACGLVRRFRIDTIHAWCTPAGMIGHLVSVLTGRPLVIDSYEPHAEAMVENGTWTPGGIAFRTLFLFERLQTRRAKVLIAATDGMRDYARRKYGATRARWFTKPACVDLGRFSRADVKRPELLKEYGLEGKVVAVYAGKFGGIYLGPEVFGLLRAAHDHWGDRLRVLLLTPHPMSELLPWIEGAGLPPSIFIVRSVPHRDVPGLMGLGDFAITPVKPVPTKRYCTPVKDGEYWALGLPVIITEGISDDSDIIRSHGIGSVLTGLDAEACRSAVEGMAAFLRSGKPEERFRRVRAVAEKYRNFDLARRIYEEVYGGAV